MCFVSRLRRDNLYWIRSLVLCWWWCVCVCWCKQRRKENDYASWWKRVLLFGSKALEWMLLMWAAATDFAFICWMACHHPSVFCLRVCGVNLKWNFHFKNIWKEIDDAPASLHFSHSFSHPFLPRSPVNAIVLPRRSKKVFIAFKTRVALYYFHQFVS